MARVPQFGAQHGQYAAPTGSHVATYGAPQAQAVLDQFEALTLGPAAPGQPGDAGEATAAAVLPVLLLLLHADCADSLC